MSENADLDKRAAEALLRYRAALARVEALEQEEAVAHRALVEWRSLVENSISTAVVPPPDRISPKPGRTPFPGCMTYELR